MCVVNRDAVAVNATGVGIMMSRHEARQRLALEFGATDIVVTQQRRSPKP